MKGIQFINISPEQLENNITNKFRKELEDFKKDLKPESSEEYLTKQEVAAMLKVGLTTIYNYTLKGYLKPVGLGKRTYYRRSDVESAMTEL